jgi:primosomal protein N' (replication factor Y)
MAFKKPLALKNAQVAVAAPVRGLYSYSIKDAMLARLQVGQLVEVPFGRGSRRGIVVEFSHLAPAGVELKEIDRIVEDDPVMRKPMLKALLWATRYYLAPPGEMIFAALPSCFRKTGRPAQPKRFRLALALGDVDPALRNKAPLQAAVLDHLTAGPKPVSDLEGLLPGARGALRLLEKKALVELSWRTETRRPAQVLLPPGNKIENLTQEQSGSSEDIGQALDAGEYKAFLLHGVTSSGKTEVYLRAIEKAIQSGRGAILLVPEISLTPQLTCRVSHRFGQTVAVLHSGLGQGERLDEWRRLQKGEAQVALGARSAIFAPVRNLGLLVVDEEHDGSYKQSERLLYNARDLAFVRARQESAVVVLGSATPSLETYSRTRLEPSDTRKVYLLEMRTRVNEKPLPEIDVVDLRRVLDPLERDHALGPELAGALAETLDRKEQAILFLNRRGYSAFALCRDCGESVRCIHCSVALVYHQKGKELRCHYCGLVLHMPIKCRACDSQRVQLFGLGTQKCEAEVRRRFPGARVIRVDSDSVAGRGKLSECMARFARGEADVLVGTQMVTKGHDIPGVTLVGVVSADLGLHLPDFRAAERTFQVITQVAGRAGRGEAGGRVIVQSFLPEHESIVLAKQNRYLDFFEKEFRKRQNMGYPPSQRLLLVRVSHVEQQVARKLSGSIALAMRQVGERRTQVLGPVVSPLARIRGRYRWQMLVKSRRIEELHKSAEFVLERLPVPRGAKIVFDVDPTDML